MKTRILGFFILLILSPKIYSNSEDIPYDQYANEIIKEFVTEMRKEFGLKCLGSGGSMPNDVESIEIMLVSYEKASEEKARELEIKATERLTAMVNAHEKIRPFLREYPFPPQRAEVMISFIDKNMKPFSSDSVALIFQAKGNLNYRAYNPKTKQYTVLFNESYEEAKKIVSKKTTPLTEQTKS
jgi:hypothetical protein